jgi:hypothetical protein
MSVNDKTPAPAEAAPKAAAPKDRLSPEQEARLAANRAAVEQATQEMIARMRSPEFKAQQERAKADADALFRRAGIRGRPGQRGRGSHGWYTTKIGG